jgi:hypothetical protein
MTRCAFEHSQGKLLFYRRGKICDLIADERSKDRPACPRMRAGSFSRKPPYEVGSCAIPMTLYANGQWTRGIVSNSASCRVSGIVMRE